MKRYKKLYKKLVSIAPRALIKIRTFITVVVLFGMIHR